MLTHNTRFARFLAEHNLTLLRLERLSGERNRIIVGHDGRKLVVSYTSRNPSKFALKKLDHAIAERGR